MSRDLEETLNEMGPGYRAVVARLRAAREAAQGIRDRGSGIKGWLIAASLLVILGLGVMFIGRESLRRETEDGGYGPREYRASVSEMIASQNADGSWTNDFLTRRNAAALKGNETPDARIAYKKAVRYLSSKGLLPVES